MMSPISSSFPFRVTLLNFLQLIHHSEPNKLKDGNLLMADPYHPLDECCETVDLRRAKATFITWTNASPETGIVFCTS